LLGGIVLAGLVFGAVVFAEERLFSDSCYYLMRTINTEWFWVEHSRWVLVLCEWLPLLGVWLDLPLPTVVLLHSLGNVVFAVGLFVYLAWGMRDAHAALALTLIHIIGLAGGLFCPIFEFYYGADLLVVFWALWHRTNFWHWKRATTLLLLATIVASSHLFGLLLLVWVMFIAWQRERSLRYTVAVSGLLVVLLVVKSFTTSEYEQMQMGFLRKIYTFGFADTQFRPIELARTFMYGLRYYPDVLLLSGLTVGWLLRRRRWAELGLYGFMLLCLYILIQSYLPDRTHDRYREQVVFAVVVFVVLFVALHLLQRLHKPRLWLLLLAGLVVFRFGLWAWVGVGYTERTDWIHQNIAQARTAGLHKGIVSHQVDFSRHTDFLTRHYFINHNWSVSIESMLLSAAEGPAHTFSLITTEDTAHADVAQHLDMYVFRMWELYPPDSVLNPTYFRLPPGVYAPVPNSNTP
jgi:hypothetical protein